ncbi:hypothetical protein M0811_13555 [Anaeramoeba ignava]|uniref:Reverse transcriptase domain-containing protein n=1 Tax=Anaeramoeba ignava TaxID=1746090 RepID=A0A9Q0L6A8_ANAIG|nr:hypothetical protein M0811_13555 [Anaeramoeba ignava]
MMREWIRDPNQEVIKYMLSRRMVLIFKQGDPNQISNYRPISINNDLVRIFLKRIFEEIEPIWEYISYQQMGFRKMMDTRIAVLELQKKLKEIKEPYIISIDIQKCFDIIDHGLIRKVINKFISNNNIKKLLNEYYKGNGCGIYQGDPLSPLIFGMVSHFIIEKIKLRVDHIQMYADDMILLVKNSYNKVITKVQSIL